MGMRTTVTGGGHGGGIAISVLAALVLSVGVIVSVQFHDILLKSETIRARDEFATMSETLARGLEAALESATASFIGMHTVMSMFPSVTFWDYSTLSSAFQTTFRHRSLEYIPFVRTEEERLQLESTIPLR